MEILMSGEFSSMVSTWIEYLCLECTADQVVLSSRGHEVLAKLSEYAVGTKDGETQYEVPDLINGETVVGREDEYIVGGMLVLHDDVAEITLKERDYEAAKIWLAERGWDHKRDFAEAWKRIAAALNLLPGHVNLSVF